MKPMLVLLGLVLAVILLTAATPGLAEAAPPPAGSTLVLLAPPVISISTPADAVPSAFLEGGYRQAERLFPLLNSLKRSGHIGGYEPVPQANAIRVDKPDFTAKLLLGRQPEVSGQTAMSAANMQAARARFTGAMLQARRAAPQPPQKRAPHPPAGTFVDTDLHETWDAVKGHYTSPPASVTADLYDSGNNLKKSVTVDTDGDGNFFANFGGQPDGDVVPGDYVKLSVYSTVKATLHADAIKIDFDDDQDHVNVAASANRTVSVTARDPGAGNCSYVEQTVEGVTDDNLDGTGDYVANMQGSVDITRRSEAEVRSVEDEANNLTSSAWRHSPFLRVGVNLTENGGNGYARQPGDDLTITLKNASDEVKDTVTNTSNYPDASFGFRFNNADILPGDTVYVDEKSTNMATVPIETLNTYIDPATDLVTGDAPAGKVTVSGKHYNRLTGQWEGGCQTVNTLGGHYSVNFGINFVGRDQSDAYYVVGDGDELHAWDEAPYLEMNTGNDVLAGAFHWNFDGEVNLTVKNSSGSTRYQGTSYAFGGRWEQLLAKNGLPVLLNTGDNVIAKPSTVVVAPNRGPERPNARSRLNGTVARLTANIDLVPDRITGNGPAKTHIAVSPYYWNGGGWDCRDECWTDVTTGSKGAYNYQFHNDLAAGDFVQALLVDASGNQTIATGFSKNPTITMVSYPALFRTGRPNEVKYNIANAVHVTDTFLGLGRASAPDLSYTDMAGPDYNWWPGGPGDYTVKAWLGSRGTVYFRAFAFVDGRWIFTNPENSAPVR